MTSSILRKSAFALAIALVGVTLYAADPPKPVAPALPGAAPQPPATAVQPPGTTDPAALPRPLRAKQLLGAKINIANNTAIGTVDDIVLTDAGEVEFLIVATADS